MDVLLRTDEIARALGVRHALIRRLVRAGHIPSPDGQHCYRSEVHGWLWRWGALSPYLAPASDAWARVVARCRADQAERLTTLRAALAPRQLLGRAATLVGQPTFPRPVNPPFWGGAHYDRATLERWLDADDGDVMITPPDQMLLTIIRLMRSVTSFTATEMATWLCCTYAEAGALAEHLADAGLLHADPRGPHPIYHLTDAGFAAARWPVGSEIETAALDQWAA